MQDPVWGGLHDRGQFGRPRRKGCEVRIRLKTLSVKCHGFATASVKVQISNCAFHDLAPTELSIRLHRSETEKLLRGAYTAPTRHWLSHRRNSVKGEASDYFAICYLLFLPYDSPRHRLPPVG